MKLVEITGTKETLERIFLKHLKSRKIEIESAESVSRDSCYIKGWMTAEDADRLIKEETDNVAVSSPDGSAMPPTKLKNIGIFKPFEEFVRMYGVPSYNELDPTPFLAIVYTLLFGIMFGDVGHGICLSLIGTVLWKRKKESPYAKILVTIGIASTVFGFMYGSFFGFEGEHALIKPLWFTPFENTRTMISTLIYAVIIGVALIVLCMVFNILNGIKQRNVQKILFSQNGAAGLLFYTLGVYCGLSAVMGRQRFLGAALWLMVISLAAIYLQEPLAGLVSGKRRRFPKDKGRFFTEAIFETLEILLSFVTNTLSFLRVGAFALVHAGMMSVVVMFMMRFNALGSLIVAVLGNALVIGLEGLVVGIQVLRLGFYEMFSRFYDGNGREFKPLDAESS